MSKKLRPVARNIAAKILPDAVKESLFRKAFSVMSDAQKDRQRVWYQMASIEWSLRNMRNLGFKPNRIIDVGAYHGDWARLAKEIFPEASILMVEAQESKENYLKELTITYPQSVFYKLALLGSERRSNVNFFEMETGSSVLYEHSNISRSLVPKKMITLDDTLEEIGWNSSDLVKLDVQGYELEVLKGGQKVLERAEAIIMEVSLLSFIDNAPLLHNVVSFMKDRGFLAYDICSFMRRPLDNALCQTDIIFIKEDSILIQNSHYNM